MSGRSITARALTGRRRRIGEHAHVRAFGRWLIACVTWLVRRTAGFALGFAALGLAAFGVFRDPGEDLTQQLLALGGLSIVVLARLFERVQRGHAMRQRQALLADLELGTLFIAAAFALIELTGGPAGLLYPLLYVLVAFLVAFHTFWPSTYFLALILGSEAAISTLQPTGLDLRLFISHASFVLLIGLLYTMFMRGEVIERRSSLRSAIQSHLEAITSEAEDFRLTSGLSFEGRDISPQQLRSRRSVGSVQAIHESLYNVLAVAERALQTHTVALLWMDADDRHMRVKELRSQSDAIVEKPIGAGEGLIGAVTKRGEPVVLTGLHGHPGLVYYRRPEPITEFAGVPVREGEHLRGVLVADRNDQRPFADDDVSVMSTIADEIVRAVQVERIFSEMDTEKYQRERFYDASRSFNRALTVEDVAQTAIDAMQKIASSEFVAIAVAVQDEEGILRVEAVKSSLGKKNSELLGYTFAAEEGLIGAAIKARHPLPHGTARAESQRIFGAHRDVDLDQIKVLPLLWKDIGVGALVLGSRRPDFLPFDLLDMLRVVAAHAAIAIANAQMYERMQRMATTDGLTALVNHRYFQELFDNHLASAERYSRELSLLLIDIDHFKLVNDTYGHPVGDRVLKRVARVLAQGARRTDVAARYGGEEFVVLLDETGRDGALQIAERIRAAVEAEEIHSETGTFNCTISLGIATYPRDATQKAAVFECADQALYQAKGRGRNRVVAFASRKKSR